MGVADYVYNENGERAFAPHCDQRILHAPKECEFCDHYPDWQELRDKWGIAFTGHSATDGGLPCPADARRPVGSESDHRAWGGNTPKPKDAMVIGHDWAGYLLTDADPRITVPQTFSEKIRKRLGI